MCVPAIAISGSCMHSVLNSRGISQFTLLHHQWAGLSMTTIHLCWCLWHHPRSVFTSSSALLSNLLWILLPPMGRGRVCSSYTVGPIYTYSVDSSILVNTRLIIDLSLVWVTSIIFNYTLIICCIICSIVYMSLLLSCINTILYLQELYCMHL